MVETRDMVRSGAALAVCAVLAWIGGTVLGEYTFQGEGIQYLPIIGGIGLGAVLAWITNRLVSGPPPMWLIGVVPVIALLGEMHAVHIDNDHGRAWPPEGWAAIIGAAAAAAYGLWTARKDRLQSS